MNALELITATVEPVASTQDPVVMATRVFGKRPVRKKKQMDEYLIWENPYCSLELAVDNNDLVMIKAKAFNTPLYGEQIYMVPSDNDYVESVREFKFVLDRMKTLMTNHKRILREIFDANYRQAAQLLESLIHVDASPRAMEQMVVNKNRREALRELL